MLLGKTVTTLIPSVPRTAFFFRYIIPQNRTPLRRRSPCQQPCFPLIHKVLHHLHTNSSNSNQFLPDNHSMWDYIAAYHPHTAYASNYTAELQAIAIALECITNNQIQNSIICRDSLSAVKKLSSPSSYKDNNLLISTKHFFFNSFHILNMRLLWIPAHRDFWGNECVVKSLSLYFINNNTSYIERFVNRLNSIRL